jgi:hypothetical protein
VTIQTISVASLKKVKNSVIGNPGLLKPNRARCSVCGRVSLSLSSSLVLTFKPVLSLVESLQSSQDDIRVEAAHMIVSSLSYGSSTPPPNSTHSLSYPSQVLLKPSPLFSALLHPNPSSMPFPAFVPLTLPLSVLHLPVLYVPLPFLSQMSSVLLNGDSHPTLPILPFFLSFPQRPSPLLHSTLPQAQVPWHTPRCPPHRSHRLVAALGERKPAKR